MIRSTIETVGIAGCGLMGSGWAQLCALKGLAVIVSEVDDPTLKKGLDSIRERLDEEVQRGHLRARDREETLSRITCTTKLEDLGRADLVIETIPEKMYLKKKIFSELDRICDPDVIIATNTSVLSVLDIARVTDRPDRVVGLNTSPLVFPVAEIIQTILLSKEALDVSVQFMQRLGKDAIVVRDTPGFILNRLVTPLILNAVRMVESGVAQASDIDRVVKISLGWPAGPLALADSIGLDTILLGATSLYHDLSDPQYAPPVTLKKMVTAGLLGCKSGRGFYEHRQPEGQAVPSETLSSC